MPELQVTEENWKLAVTGYALLAIIGGIGGMATAGCAAFGVGELEDIKDYWGLVAFGAGVSLAIGVYGGYSTIKRRNAIRALAAAAQTMVIDPHNAEIQRLQQEGRTLQQDAAKFRDMFLANRTALKAYVDLVARQAERDDQEIRQLLVELNWADEGDELPLDVVHPHTRPSVGSNRAASFGSPVPRKHPESR
jgi:hypothetical protein